jgi:ubiquinone/menaquinone biosynthesis C-methylase UbiE
VHPDISSLAMVALRKMCFRSNFYSRMVKEREKKFLSLLEKQTQAKSIDLGCGEGNFTLKVKGKVQCKEIFGVDICDEAIEEARKKGIKVLKLDLNKPLSLPSNSFDIVVSNQVI